VKFSGKRILITGASRGLGYVAAQAFAKEGAKLLLVARDARRLNDLHALLHNPDQHYHMSMDLTDECMAESLVECAREMFGGIDIILHCMGGGFGHRDPLLSWEQFETLHRSNIGVAAELNRLLIPGMIERGWGRVIHVGSTASGEACGSVGYNTCKAALAAYVRSLGNALAGQGVVVTGVNPGAFYAPENAMHRFEQRNPEVFCEWVERRLPRGYVGKAEEILPLLFLLASDEASMMAGSCVAIDAGESVAYAG